MRVIIPSTYTQYEDDEALTRREMVYDAVKAAGDGRHAWQWWYVGGSDRAYFDLLADLWAKGETFAIVEHDVIVGVDTLDVMAACGQDWCSCPYYYMGKVTHALGCSKFSAQLIERNPDAMARVGVMSDARHPKRHWCRLDAWLTCVLEGNGERRHSHQTLVRHLGIGCSHGCTTNP